MKTGVSVYFSNGIEYNERIIEKARKAGASYAFTSMHIPEETGIDYGRDARHILKLLSEAGMALIVDVGPETSEKLGCSSIEELADLGITHIRLDYGFTPEQTVELSRRFHIVCNASTVSREEIFAWQHTGADLSRFTACHNYYPKPYTGLGLAYVRSVNERLSTLGFETIGFVPGNGDLRGPLHEGLPMIEAQRARRNDVALNMIEAGIGGCCDAVLVGDPGLSEQGWHAFSGVSRGYVELRARLRDRYAYLYGQIHHDRPDSSEQIMRSQESRTTFKPTVIEPDAGAGQVRPCGTVAVSNADYARYMGELEISRKDLPGDTRVNVAGTVDERDRRLLPFIRGGFGWKLVRGSER